MLFRRNSDVSRTAGTSTKKNRVRAAVIAGAFIAIPVAGMATATSASAASTDSWNALAQCEASGNWAANTGNGFYGGLQFTPSTWAAFGGTQYAASADQASSTQQIAIGEKVLAAQGAGAWPVCSVKVGLS